MNKQIEEMKNDIAEFWANGDFDKVVEEFINLGYRKIPEGAVVLTMEEKQKLLHEMYEQGRFDAIADLEKEGKVILTREEYDEIKQFSGYILEIKKAFDSIRNATAKKFAERLKEGLNSLIPFDGYDIIHFEFDGMAVLQVIDEIVKELTGEEQ